jgi:hypothetical protein
LKSAPGVGPHPQHLLHVQLGVVVLRDAGRPQRKVFVALNQTAEIEAGMAKN